MVNRITVATLLWELHYRTHKMGCFLQKNNVGEVKLTSLLVKNAISFLYLGVIQT